VSFEETLVCDGCSRIIDGGSREQTLGTLRDEGGLAYDKNRRDEWEGRPTSEPWASTRRHLCGGCVEQGVARFYDETPIPATAR
jgi:hypothetical protein